MPLHTVDQLVEYHLRPAMSLPLHNMRIDGVELPIGIMIGGRLYDEATLLALGCALENTRDCERNCR